MRTFHAFGGVIEKKGVTGPIFKEFLLWLDNRMAFRSICLFIDGFLAHHAGNDLLHADHLKGLDHILDFFNLPFVNLLIKTSLKSSNLIAHNDGCGISRKSLMQIAFHSDS